MADLLNRARAWLVPCGSCDAGLPMPCTCWDPNDPADPRSGDSRPIIFELVAEIERLQDGAR